MLVDEFLDPLGITQRELAKALSEQTLTDEHRAILVLREMQEHSYEDIAEILEISIGTVRSRLSRARRQLKIALEAMQRAEESTG